MTALVYGRVVGSQAVIRRFGVTAPEEIRRRVRATIRALGYTLQRNVVSGQLAGEVLNRRSGRLARSINTKFFETADVFRAMTGTKLVYGRAWELGFDLPERDIYPKDPAGALFWPGAAHPVKHVHQPARHQAARPWLAPALHAMGPIIQRDLSLAMRGL